MNSVMETIKDGPLSVLLHYYGPQSRPGPAKDKTSEAMDLMLGMSLPTAVHEEHTRHAMGMFASDPEVSYPEKIEIIPKSASEIVSDQDMRIRQAFNSYGRWLPPFI